LAVAVQVVAMFRSKKTNMSKEIVYEEIGSEK